MNSVEMPARTHSRIEPLAAACQVKRRSGYARREVNRPALAGKPLEGYCRNLPVGETANRGRSNMKGLWAPLLGFVLAAPLLIAPTARAQTLNGNSVAPSLSADGRFVAFFSDASNLVAGDTNGVQDVFIRDRATGETSRVSVATDGTQANAPSGGVGIIPLNIIFERPP